MEPLSVPGTLDALSAIAAWVKAAAASAGLDRDATYRLRLAVDEIVTNIVTHGYAGAVLAGNIDLRAEIDDHALTVCVEDTGVAFDPTQVETPRGMDLPLEDRSMGGLGVYLVTQNVDGFRYERIGDRNRNILIVVRPVAPAGA